MASLATAAGSVGAGLCSSNRINGCEELRLSSFTAWEFSSLVGALAWRAIVDGIADAMLYLLVE